MHRLALALGRTVAELVEAIDLDELLGWLAYWSAEPWGEMRADQRMAVGLYYQLLPWMDSAADEPPALEYPYFDDPEETAAAIKSAVEEYRKADEHWRAEIDRMCGRKTGGESHEAKTGNQGAA